METLRYPYRPKTWVMALAGLFFAGCAAVLWVTARDNDRGATINYLIELDVGQATILYWVMCAMCVAFVAVAISGVIRSLRAPGEVMVDSTGVTVPSRGKAVMIPFASITDLRMQQVRSQNFLIIHHRAGKATVIQSLMPSRADFDTFVAAVAARCGRLR